METQLLVNVIGKLTLKQASDLVAALKSTLDIELPTARPQRSAPIHPSAPVDPVDFSVELTAAGSQKISVIKVIRELTGLGLAEAKTLVESAPMLLKEAAEKTEAENIRRRLSEAGATVTVRPA